MTPPGTSDSLPVMDTFLVTGGTGNIGTAFVAALASDARAPRIRVATRDPVNNVHVVRRHDV